MVIHIIVHTLIKATVAMQSFHIQKYPISIKAIALPTTNFQLLEPNQAKIHITNIIIGQGVVINNLSNHTKKNNNVSKKFSIASPYFREKNLKLKSQEITSQRNFLIKLGILERAEIISKNLGFSKKADLTWIGILFIMDA